jgi:antitoxin ChpS
MAITTKLKKVGGSVMLAIPPALLKMLGVGADSSVDLTLEADALVIRTTARPLTLDDLIEASGDPLPLSEEDREWLDSPPAGREII